MSQFDDSFFKEMEGFSCIVTPTEQQSTNYYNDYCRLYLANVVLTSQIIRETKELEERIYHMEEKQYEFEESDDADKNKRHRRTAGQVSRFHKCTVSNCNKSYGSEGSLNQHIKIKHPEHLKEKEDEDSNQSGKIKKQNRSQNQNQNYNQNHDYYSNYDQNNHFSQKVKVEEALNPKKIKGRKY